MGAQEWGRSLLGKFGLKGRAQWSWAFYDWGNSGFATTIMTAILPIYFFDVAAKDLGENVRTALWAYISAGSLLVTALLSPLLGALADLYGRKKMFLAIFTVLGIIGSALLYFVGEGDYVIASIAYLIGNIGFSGGMIFYDCLLPHIAEEDERDAVSLSGFAFGYLGGGLLLLANMLWIMNFDAWGFASKSDAVRWSFLSVAVWWGLSTIPVMLWVEEPKTTARPDRDLHPFRNAWERLQGTFRDLKRYRQVMLFLIAFWIYSDGIGTVMKMATTYGREIGISQSNLMLSLLAVQFLGLPCTLFYTPLMNRFKPKSLLLGTLGVYSLVCILGYYLESAWQFWMLAIMVAMVQGGSQALSRSIFANMIPKSRSGEFFSFFSVSAKFAGVFGPAMFGVISQVMGESRLSILSLLILFIGGAFLLMKVDVDAK